MRKLPLSIFLLAPLVALGIYACDEVPVEPESQQQSDFLAANVQNGNPFLGSWVMTSAVVGDADMVVGRVRYIMTFRSDETYAVSISHDEEQLACNYLPGPPQTSCAWEGTYVVTLTAITLDEIDGPEPGPDSMGYVFCGGRLMLTEAGVRLTLKRAGQGP